MRTLLTVICSGAFLASGAPAIADDTPAPGEVAEGAFDDSGARVTTTLMSDVVAAEAGDSIRVGVRFDVSPGWHIYWKNPGQTGLSTEVAFTLGDTEYQVDTWPAPEVFQTDDGFITSYGYEGSVLLPAGVTIPEGASEISVSAAADYLVCDSTCIPGRNEMRLVIPVGERQPSGNVAAFDETTRSAPVEASSLGWTVIAPALDEALLPGQSIEVTIGVDTGPESEALPESGSLQIGDADHMLVYERTSQISVDTLGVSHAPEGRRGVLLNVRLTAGADPVAEDQAFEGVLLVHDRTARHAIRIHFPIPRNTTENHEN